LKTPTSERYFKYEDGEPCYEMVATAAELAEMRDESNNERDGPDREPTIVEARGDVYDCIRFFKEDYPELAELKPVQKFLDRIQDCLG
jgi:hypothetical protein